MKTRELWRRITATRYTRALEAEVVRQGAEISRLRGENRALLNSILGIAGIPPIPVDLPDASRGMGAASSAPTNDIQSGVVALRNQQAGSGAAEKSNIGASGVKTPDEKPRRMSELKLRPPKTQLPPAAASAPPMRRRSWQQISRMLEFESARKTVASG